MPTSLPTPRVRHQGHHPAHYLHHLIMFTTKGLRAEAMSWQVNMFLCCARLPSPGFLAVGGLFVVFQLYTSKKQSPGGVRLGPRPSTLNNLGRWPCIWPHLLHGGMRHLLRGAPGEHAPVRAPPEKAINMAIEVASPGHTLSTRREAGMRGEREWTLGKDPAKSRKEVCHGF